MNADIAAYNIAVPEEHREICERLAEEIARGLPEADSKIWHGAPVWFLEGNPIVGYWSRKRHVQLLFWSGQTFDEPGLKPEGKFKAAEAWITAPEQIDAIDLLRWLKKGREIQWDYKNIVKRKGVLERLR